MSSCVALYRIFFTRNLQNRFEYFPQFQSRSFDFFFSFQCCSLRNPWSSTLLPFMWNLPNAHPHPKIKLSSQWHCDAIIICVRIESLCFFCPTPLLPHKSYRSTDNQSLTTGSGGSTRNHWLWRQCWPSFWFTPNIWFCWDVLHGAKSFRRPNGEQKHGVWFSFDLLFNVKLG